MRFSVRVVSCAVVVACVACRDVPQAPTQPPPPEAEPFAVLHVDHVRPLSDCCGLIAQPTLFADAAGSLHLLYGAWDVGAVRYAGCATDCALAPSWRVGEVDSSFYGVGDGGQVTAGLTSSGIHLLYQSTVANGQIAFLSYGWCPGSCYLKASWQRGVVDTMAPITAAGSGGASAVVDPAGGIHALYLARDGVRYAACPAVCTNAANWQRATLDSANSPATALALAGDGRLHALYFRSGNLWYATCATACGDSTNWQRGAIAPPPTCCHLNSWTALAIGSDNRLHALFSATTDTSWRISTLTYATCTASCTSAGNWRSLTVDSTASLGAIALGADGAVHLMLGRTTGVFDGTIEYARCDTACLSLAAWTRTSVDSTKRALSLTLALTLTGKPMIGVATFYDVYVALMR